MPSTPTTVTVKNGLNSKLVSPSNPPQLHFRNVIRTYNASWGVKPSLQVGFVCVKLAPIPISMGITVVDFKPRRKQHVCRGIIGPKFCQIANVSTPPDSPERELSIGVFKAEIGAVSREVRPFT
jgi:hypothetical protein